MGLPQPTVALTDVCSVIFNNTLYTYSTAAFQALPLTQGAKWTQLPSGEAVTGGVCVGSTPSDAAQAGFYVVGGTSTNSSYSGLQKFTYATQQWSVIAPQELVTQSRLYHGATYITDSDMLLVYAGSQDGTKALSSQTFTIQASAPYGVLAYESVAPPTIDPLLLTWSSSEAALIGGSTSNSKVMLFNPSSGGWTDSGATLLTPLTKDRSSLQAVVATGDDNSKSLFTFDASVSPNQVARMVLMTADGQPETNAAPVKRAVSADGTFADFRRDTASSLTLADWPAYNATLAPTSVRSDFALAQDASGMVVMAGGSGNDDVLCVFNVRTNSWRNATSMLSKQATVSLVSSSLSASATSTSSPSTLVIAPTTSATISATPATTTTSAATSAAAAAATPSGLSAHLIIAITLSSVAGVGILMILAYSLLRCRRKRTHVESANGSNANGSGSNNSNNIRRTSETSSSEKDSYIIMGNDTFVSKGMPASKGTFKGYHKTDDSQASLSSVAILMGRVNQPKPSGNIQRNNSRSTNRTSTSSLFNKAFKSTISKPILQTTENSLAASALPQTAQFERVPSNSYGHGVSEARQPSMNQGQLLRQGSTRRSSGWNRYWSGGSTLNILGFGNGQGSNANGTRGSAAMSSQNNGNSQRATVVSDVSSRYSVDPTHRITQDSATVPPLEIPPRDLDSKPRFQRVNSGSPTVSNYESFLKESMQGKIERPHSRSSSHSGYSSGIPASVQDSWDPTTASSKPWGFNRAPSNSFSGGGSSFASPLSNPSASSSAKRAYVPSGMSRQPQLAMANTSSDMSWLNLGDVSRI